MANKADIFCHSIQTHQKIIILILHHGVLGFWGFGVLGVLEVLGGLGVLGVLGVLGFF